MIFTKDIHGFLSKHIVSNEASILSVDDLVNVIHVRSGDADKIPVSSLVLDKGLYAVMPSNFFDFSVKTGLVLSAVGSRYIEELVSKVSESPVYTDKELSALSSINTNKAGESSSCANEGVAQSVVTSKKRKQSKSKEPSSDAEESETKKSKKRKHVFMDEEDEIDDDHCVGVDQVSPGDWIVSKCEFSVRNKLTINYYVGQILFPGNEVGDIGDDEVGVQFYRSDIASTNDHVYKQLQNKEIVDKSTIVEKIDKPEILLGGRVKLLSLPKIGKLV